MDLSKWTERTVEKSLTKELSRTFQNMNIAAGQSPSKLPINPDPSARAGGLYGGYQVNQGIQKEIYEYLINEKKLNDYQALGLMANISRESSFNPAVNTGDGGNSWGLFQWNHGAGRRDPFVAAVPDWQTNWKAQIDYALDGESAYRNVQVKFKTTEWASAYDAAEYWMREFENPADKAGANAYHQRYLASVPKGPTGSAQFRAKTTTGGSGSFNVIQYLTGDTTYRAGPGVNPNQFYYDPDHGGSKYHEHFGFNTIEDKNRAMRHLRNQGWEIGSTYRSGDPGLHGSNLAFDVPFYKPSDGGTQKGFSNDTAGEQAFSAAVRASMGMFHGGSTGKGGIIFTHPGEYIIDKDTVDLLGTDFFDSANQIENESQLKQKSGLLISKLSQYAPYDERTKKTVVVPIPQPQQPIPYPVTGNSSSAMSGVLPVGGTEDAFKQLYMGN